MTTGLIPDLTTDQFPADVLARFMAKIAKTDDCWLWIGARATAGYGTFNLGRTEGTRRKYRYTYAHRLSYEIHVGPIPGGLTIDHLCRVRHCVNPAHLEAVTQGENTRRAAAALRTTCPQGHPYDGHRSSGSRCCTICDLRNQKARIERKRLERVAAREARAA